MMRNVVEFVRILKAVGLRRFFKVLRISREVTPLVKGYALTQVIGSLQQLSFFELLQKGPASTEKLAQAFSLRADLLDSVLSYLYAAGILKKKADQWFLSEYGTFVTLEPHGLFLLYRAYGSIFNNLNPLLKGEVEYGREIHRDEPWMATGSAHIVRWLPVPVVMNWLAEFKCRSLLDIGCGAGDFLNEVGKSGAFNPLVGADRSPDIIRLAATRNPGTEITGPIHYHVADAMIPDDLAHLKMQVPHIDAVSIMFVLHELVYVSVETARLFLSNLRQAYPAARVFICELVAPPLEKRANARSGNELLLYHSLSHQRPLPVEEWSRLFSAAGYKIEKMETFDLMAQAYFTLLPR